MLLLFAVQSQNKPILQDMIPGTILRSDNAEAGDYFAGTHILIAEVNKEGAIGYILNRKFPRPFNQLAEFADSPPFPLFEGGPVEHEKLFFIHRRPDLIEGGVCLQKDIYSGGDFKKAVSYLNMGLLSEADLKMFIGYCGWDAGQLEAEIAAGDWQIQNEFPVF